MLCIAKIVCGLGASVQRAAQRWSKPPQYRQPAGGVQATKLGLECARLMYMHVLRVPLRSAYWPAFICAVYLCNFFIYMHIDRHHHRNCLQLAAASTSAVLVQSSLPSARPTPSQRNGEAAVPTHEVLEIVLLGGCLYLNHMNTALYYSLRRAVNRLLALFNQIDRLWLVAVSDHFLQFVM